MQNELPHRTAVESWTRPRLHLTTTETWIVKLDIELASSQHLSITKTTLLLLLLPMTNTASPDISSRIATMRNWRGCDLIIAVVAIILAASLFAVLADEPFDRNQLPLSKTLCSHLRGADQSLSLGGEGKQGSWTAFELLDLDPNQWPFNATHLPSDEREHEIAKKKMNQLVSEAYFAFQEDVAARLEDDVMRSNPSEIADEDEAIHDDTSEPQGEATAQTDSPDKRSPLRAKVMATNIALSMLSDSDLRKLYLQWLRETEKHRGRSTQLLLERCELIMRA